MLLGQYLQYFQYMNLLVNIPVFYNILIVIAQWNKRRIKKGGGGLLYFA